MKKVETNIETLFVGTAREIMSLYRNLRNREIAIPVFSSTPRLNPEKLYGLVLEELDPLLEVSHEVPKMTIVTSDVIVSILLDM